MSVPQYFLYGESTRDVDQHFMHVESIAARSTLHDWRIQPHAHRELQHLMWIARGSGVFNVEGKAMRFHSPALICVPMHCVHGFQFEHDTEGWVVTAASTLLHRLSLVHPELQSFLREPALYALTPAVVRQLASKFAILVDEFHGERIARRAAAESALLSILVDAIRLKLVDEAEVTTPHDADSDLVNRYRALIEENFKQRLGAADYAARLCISHERLRLACVRVTGSSPLVLLNARRLLEAKRALLYTNMNITMLARSCGFEDPAYFSRFFARNTGKSPRDYRAAHHTAWQAFAPQPGVGQREGRAAP